MSADVVGYSRLMGADEVGTLSRLNVLRRELIDPAIAAHSGRIVKLMGDGALVEFASAVDAVTCAIQIQRQLRERDTGGTDRSGFGSGSMLATSSSRVTTSSATGSILQREWRALLSPVVFASQTPPTTRCAIS